MTLAEAGFGTGEAAISASVVLGILWTISWASWQGRGKKQDALEKAQTDSEAKHLERNTRDAERYAAMERDLMREVTRLDLAVAVLKEQKCDERLKVQEQLSAAVALQLQSLGESSKRVEAQLARMDRHRRTTDEKEET